MKEYKVLNQKDGLYSGKFNPEKFEKLLNKYAAEGWKVISTSPVSVPSFGGNRQEILVILERDYELAEIPESVNLENPIKNMEKTIRK